MNKQQLNSLVLAYQNGDETALSDLFRAVNPIIEKASREIEPFVEDFTKFDCRMVKKIQRLAEKFEYGKHDFLAAVKAIVSRDKAQYIRRNSRKRSGDMPMSILEGDGEEDLGYQFEADGRTEDYVMFKERVTLLAQGNPRKETILLQWSRGAEDKSISELLAQLYGGKAESHRKFIQRFRTDCKELL